MPMIIPATLFTLLMGVTLGLLGGGGSILTLPILTQVLSVPTREAIAMSLVVVGVTSVVAVVGHWRRGNVDVPVALIFGGFAMAGSFAGGWLAAFVPEVALLLLFGALMLVTALAMVGPRHEPAAAAGHKAAIWKIGLEGVIVGVVTGMVGAGGGFLVVPALVLLGGLDMRRAVGTSLLIIALKSSSGYLGHASHVHIDFTLTAMVSVVATVGALLGAYLVRFVEAAKLRAAFGYFVLVMGVYMLSAPIGGLLGVPAWGAGVGLTILSAIAVFVRLWSAGSRRRSPLIVTV